MDFTKTTKDFARNPLGIVALFISLIYGFASLLLGTAADKLESFERWPLLIFIVVFPFSVLWVFYKLVTEHHGKLYSPGDYKNDRSFLSTLTPEEQENKLRVNVQEASGGLTVKAGNSSRTDSKLRDRIVNAEKYITEKISTELGIEAEANIKVSKEKYTFDAAYVVPGQKATFLDVKYYSHPTIVFKSVEEFLYRAKLTQSFMSIKTKFILALAFDKKNTNFDSFVDVWKSSISEQDLDIEIRVFDSNEIEA
ncbi:hypothetical protein [Vibrio genomosp. F6]|uniref:Uncharacterized protein n=1 Tax=Vibrio genomosp. F6 str. FF-238 TaxID=1191298 RepID=A0A1E5D038_9VIBR|nr:hypothetical protein [Vibrio genomosp. F6]OEE76633.1 hypothetical protein A130_15455 [Vibrio genomosp. F6 str. FF-238]